MVRLRRSCVVASLRPCVDDITVDLAELSDESGCRQVVSDFRLPSLSPTLDHGARRQVVPLINTLGPSTVSSTYSTDRTVVVTFVGPDVVQSAVSLMSHRVVITSVP